MTQSDAPSATLNDVVTAATKELWSAAIPKVMLY